MNSIPEELKAYKNWVLWGKDGTKQPWNPNNIRYMAKADDPKTWGTYVQCQNLLKAYPDIYKGVGFEGGGSPYMLIDFDFKGLEEYEIPELAANFIDWLDTYWEYSPSMKGVHVIGKVDKERLEREGWKDIKCPMGAFFDRLDKAGDIPQGSVIEMYAGNRYFTVTGDTGEAKPITDITDQILRVYRKLQQFSRHRLKAAEPTQSSDAGYLTRIKRALDVPDIRRAWDGEDNFGDHTRSAGDWFLISRLCFWLDGKPDWLDSAFRESNRMRPKWDEGRGGITYGQRTIERAIEKWDGRSYDPKLGVIPETPWSQCAPALRVVGESIIARSQSHHRVKDALRRTLNFVCDALQNPGNVHTLMGQQVLFFGGTTEMGNRHEAKFRLSQMNQLGISIRFDAFQDGVGSPIVGFLPSSPESMPIWGLGDADFSFAPYRPGRYTPVRGLETPEICPEKPENPVIAKIPCEMGLGFIPTSIYNKHNSSLVGSVLSGGLCRVDLQGLRKARVALVFIPEDARGCTRMPVKAPRLARQHQGYPPDVGRGFKAILFHSPSGPPELTHPPPTCVLAK